MTLNEAPKAFGAGLIALDLVLGMDPAAPVKSWTGGTCGNVHFLAGSHSPSLG